MKFLVSLFCLVMAVFWTSSVDAAPRRLSNLGESNNLTDKKFNTGDSSTPRGDEMFGEGKDRIKFGEWHGSYSTIGDKRADALKTRGGQEFRTGSEINYDTMERKEATISLDSDDRKIATVQNWNRVRDNVISHKFSGTEMNTPEARRFSEMVDEMSLRDVNRYQFWQNKTDEGIPIQVAGSDEGPAMSAEQRRVKARISGDDVSVESYESLEPKNMAGESSLSKSEESGFFESLFDW